MLATFRLQLIDEPFVVENSSTTAHLPSQIAGASLIATSIAFLSQLIDVQVRICCVLLRDAEFSRVLLAVLARVSTTEYLFDISLPRLPKRFHLEQSGKRNTRMIAMCNIANGC